MKQGLLKAILMGVILVPCTLIAQTPAGAPAGTTGKCKDGTFTTASKRQGACRGHKGVDTWYASAAAPVTSPAATSSGTPSSAATAESPKVGHTETSRSNASGTGSPSAKTPAPGGGPGLVWVNTASNVYHCYGTRYYGTTKAGKYVSEADAKAAGAHPDHGKACSQ